MVTIESLIVKHAKSYLGKKEISGNMGFQDPELSREMAAIGFENGEAWCAMATHLIWSKAYKEYNSFMLPVLNKLFSKGAVATYNQFRKSKLFKTSKTPQVGAVVIWQKYVNGKPDWRGHAAIVISIKGDHFFTVEGNTSNQGGRTGDGFYSLYRPLVKKELPNQLRLKGFIIPNTDATPIEIETELNS